MEIKLAQGVTSMPIDLALSNSLGFGGQNTALAIAPA
jgi:3-oxoacyl-[acyl-carrier-protein] synthase II